MPRKPGNHGFTLVEMLVVIAIIAILVAIVLFLLLRSNDRANAAANAANLRVAEGVLTLALLDDPGAFDALSAQILATAPTAAGINLPGMSLDEGTKMDAVVSGSKVDTQFGPFDKEDFADAAEDGVFDGAPTTAPALLYCGVRTCPNTVPEEGMFCPDHDAKTCQKSLKSGNTLVLCGNSYREQCGNTHYMWSPCGCSFKQSGNKQCRCGHWHSGYTCTELKIVEDNRPN